MRRRLLAPALLGLAAACGTASSLDADAGLDEPLVAHGATFVRGPLPGTPPLPEGAPEGDAVAPRVATVESLNNVVRQGQVGKKLAGQATVDARSIALRFPDEGSGYWTFPVDVVDPQQKDRVTWEVVVDVGRTVLPGLRTLRFAAIDEAGRAGTQRDLKVCVPDSIEGIHACDAKKPLPAARIVLTWDAPVDLDLHVVTPSGKDVSAKNPTTAKESPDGGTAPAATDGVVDRDSNRACVVDAIDAEILTFPVYPEKGTYRLYANLFDACGRPNVHFRVAVWVTEGEGEAAHMVSKFEREGVLSSVDASPTGPGLFLSDFIF